MTGNMKIQHNNHILKTKVETKVF